MCDVLLFTLLIRATFLLEIGRLSVIVLVDSHGIDHSLRDIITSLLVGLRIHIPLVMMKMRQVYRLVLYYQGVGICRAVGSVYTI